MKFTLFAFTASTLGLGIQIQAAAANLPNANPTMLLILLGCSTINCFFLLNERPIP